MKKIWKNYEQYRVTANAFMMTGTLLIAVEPNGCNQNLLLQPTHYCS